DYRGRAAARGVEPLLDVDSRGPLHAGCVDGASQAVLPRLHDRQHRLVRWTGGARRDAGCRSRDDQGRRRLVGRGHRRGLLSHAAPDYAAVLTMLASERSPALEEALGPGSPIVVFEKVSLA